jgi:hypothetical protein
MEMAYIESFRQLPNFAGPAPSPRHHPPSSPFSGGNGLPPPPPVTSSSLMLQRSSSSSGVGVVGQPQAELPRLLQAAATINGLTGDGSAPGGRIVKPQGLKPTEQDFFPLLGKKKEPYKLLYSAKDVMSQ